MMGKRPQQHAQQRPQHLSSRTTSKQAVTTGTTSLASSVSSSSVTSPTLPNMPPPPVPSSTTERKAPRSKDAEGNINVVVRCRGRSMQEITQNTALVASVSGHRGKAVKLTDPSPAIASSSRMPGLDNIGAPTVRTYDFGERPIEGRDPQGNVFGPDADQVMLYNDVARPILDQVLQGYNCTIFAYGQTGTGKTYTMEGDLSLAQGISRSAGIIPRTLYSLFHKLAEDKSEYSVRCSFVELYNEELRDLNALEFVEPHAMAQPMDNRGSHANNATAANGTGGGGLRIYDDKNAGSGVVIQGLEETLITSAEEGIKVLKRGSERRQIAATKCNEQSSRSHSIFTITIHIKEASKTGGEDLLKVGKLNLVDLAGSENVGRSGAKEGRAREAGMINTSLLALGRVINKLVEKNSHIPYRESKLTRLLQDSLGGRTKTTIIATISPVNFDETISTLDYALRAKTIQNRPEVNQRMTKNILLGQYATEIERLKADLLAAREKNGIFFSSASWGELAAEQEVRRIQLEEAKRQIEINDAQLETTRDQFEQSMRLLGTREEELKKVSEEMRRQSQELVELARELGETKDGLEEETVLREAFERSRGGWKGTAGKAIEDVDGLRAKLARKTDVERANLAIVTDASSSFTSTTNDLARQMAEFTLSQQAFVAQVKSRLDEFSTRETQSLEANVSYINDRVSSLELDSSKVFAITSDLEDQAEQFRSLVGATRDELVESLVKRAEEAATQQQETAQIIMDGLTDHAAETVAAIEALIAPIRALNAETVLSLAKDAELLRTVQEEDKKALEAENTRLRNVVAQLTSALEHERATSTAEDGELIALLTAKLAARSTRQAAAFTSTTALASSELADVADNRSKAVDSRTEQLRTLEERNAEVRSSLETNVQEVEEKAKQGQMDLKKALDGVWEDVERYQSAVWKSGQEQIDVVRRAGASLDAGGAAFRTDASTSAIALKEQFVSLVSDARRGYETCMEQFVVVREGIHDTNAATRDDLDSHSRDTTAFTSSSTSQLTSLNANIVSNLSNAIRLDVSTGLTPRKREWPRDKMLPAVDLDGERPTMLDALLRARREGTIAYNADEVVDAPADQQAFVNSTDRTATRQETLEIYGDDDDDEALGEDAEDPYESPTPPLVTLSSPDLDADDLLVVEDVTAPIPQAFIKTVEATTPMMKTRALGEQNQNLRRSGRKARS